MLHHSVMYRKGFICPSLYYIIWSSSSHLLHSASWFLETLITHIPGFKPNIIKVLKFVSQNTDVKLHLIISHKIIQSICLLVKVGKLVLQENLFKRAESAFFLIFITQIRTAQYEEKMQCAIIIDYRDNDICDKYITEITEYSVLPFFSILLNLGKWLVWF